MPGMCFSRRWVTGASKFRVQMALRIDRESRYVISGTRPACGTIFCMAVRSMDLTASIACEDSAGGREWMWLRMSTDLGIPRAERICENIQVWGWLYMDVC